jgi:hypothetical protein
MRHRFVAVRAAVLFVALTLAAGHASHAQAPSRLPERLSNAAFWAMSQEMSEPNGSFRSDNLVSNEIWFQYIVPELTAHLKPGGVYMGVGPEQNFTYIAALKPKLVILVDVRRGNLQLHLMYKALFELNATRADFAAMLFSREKPATLTAASTVVDIFSGLVSAPTSDTLFEANLKRILEHLTKTRGLPLDEDDVRGIRYVYENFYRFGPDLTYSSSTGGGGGRGRYTTYSSLMTATDGAGTTRSYLASDALFAVLKDLHTRNLMVPIVGNFAGPTALRAVGRYLKEQGATLSAFYLSNVEQYLSQSGIWQTFCNNVAALPLTNDSTFIYSEGGGGRGGGGGLGSYYRPILQDVKAYNCRAQ